MAFTKHGHYIEGSPLTDPDPETRARCGGPARCTMCEFDVKDWQKADAWSKRNDPKVVKSKPVPLVMYTNGKREVIGEARVGSDGSIQAKFKDGYEFLTGFATDKSYSIDFDMEDARKKLNTLLCGMNPPEENK